MESPAKEESRRQARKNGAPRRRVLRFESDTAAKYEDIPSSFGPERTAAAFARSTIRAHPVCERMGRNRARKEKDQSLRIGLPYKPLPGWMAFCTRGNATRQGQRISGTCYSLAFSVLGVLAVAAGRLGEATLKGADETGSVFVADGVCDFLDA